MEQRPPLTSANAILNKTNGTNGNSEVNTSDEEIISDGDVSCIEERLRSINDNLERINNMQNSLSSISIGEQYKMIYDRQLRPAIDIVAFMSSSTFNIVKSAESYNLNMYSDRRLVKKAIKISERLLDEVEKGLDLFDWELKCLIKESSIPNKKDF